MRWGGATGRLGLCRWPKKKTAKALPQPPEQRHLRGQTDLELFKADVRFVKLQPQAVDWGAADPWADVRVRVVLQAAAVVEADVQGVLAYLRGSSRFQPSDVWKKALDKAMQEIGYLRAE